MYVLINPFAMHATISPIPVLIEIPSIAIWNRKKVIMVTAITLWSINVGILVQGKILLFSRGGDLEFNTNR